MIQKPGDFGPGIAKNSDRLDLYLCYLTDIMLNVGEAEMKLVIAIVTIGVLVALTATGDVSHANLLQDPGFELPSSRTGFEYWVTDGLFTVPTTRANENNSQWVHSGQYSVSMSDIVGGGGSVSQSFTLPESPSLFFGAYIRLVTTNPDANWDRAQMELEFASGNTTAAVSLDQLSFSPFSIDGVSTLYRSDWTLLRGEADIAGMVGNTASLNISLQDFSGAITFLHVDDAYVMAHAPVPYPVWLLGSGLFALLGFRRKLRLV